MNRIRLLAVALALAGWSAASVAQQSAPAPAAQKPTAQAPAAEPAKPDGAAPTPPPDAPAPPRGVLRDDEFVPTQELQPEDEATFPVDI